MWVDGIAAIPAGAVAHGVVTTARASGNVKGRAHLAFRFDSLNIGGNRYAIESSVLSYQADGTKTDDAKTIGIGAGAGADRRWAVRAGPRDQ